MKTVQNVESEAQKMKGIRKLKIFIIAGEVSGDVLGAKIMREMSGVDFVGVGGQNMTKAGLKSLFPMSDLSVMGIFEVLGHAKTLTARIKQTINAIINEKPDIVLTIDSPGFAKSVVRGVRKSGINQPKYYHVVAPQVWAWGAKRAGKYAETFDKLYAFFDFELPYFEKYGLNTVAVGHPIVDGLDKYKKTKNDNKKIITFVPGSRMSEVKKLLPLFHKTVDVLQLLSGQDYEYVIPTVETTDEYIRNDIKSWKHKPKLVKSDNRYDVYANTYIAVVASGTVSAELAIMHIPTIVVYKMNPLTSLLAHILVRVKWVSLVNILMNKTIFPELLGRKAKYQEIVKHIQHLTITKNRAKMIKELTSADSLWTNNGKNAAKTIADDILHSF